MVTDRDITIEGMIYFCCPTQESFWEMKFMSSITISPDDMISKNPRNGWILSSLHTLQKRLVDDELHKMFVYLVMPSTREKLKDEVYDFFQ